MKVTIERENLKWGDFFISQSGSLYYIALLYATADNSVSEEICAIINFKTGQVFTYVDKNEINEYLDAFEEKYGKIRKVAPKEIIFK